MILPDKTMNILRIIDSRGISSEYSLALQEGEQLSFGRSDACDISLPEEGTLSRTHCHIYCRHGRIFIRDNGSVNGVLCNDVSVVEAEMHPGQAFVLGLCTLSLESYDDMPASRVAESAVFVPIPPVFSEGEDVLPAAPGEETPVAVEASSVSSSFVPLSEPLPVSAIPLREPLPVSAAAVPRGTAFPAPAAGALPPAVAVLPDPSPVPSPGTPVHVSVKKRRLTASVVAPRQLIHGVAPTPRPKKQYATRSVKTAAPKRAGKKKKRRLNISEEKWMDASAMPEASSGAALGLPVDFGVQLRPLVTRYPMRADDMMALTVAAEEKCYVAVIQYDASGVPSLIIPGSKRDNTAVFPHVLTRFPQATDADYELVIEEPFGPVHLVLLACNRPCNWFAAYKKALETLGPAPYPGKLEAAIIASVPAAEAPLRWGSSMILLHTTA